MTALIRATLSLIAALVFTSSIVVAQQQESVEARLQGFDSYMEQVMKDWNAPGIGIGIVMGNRLVFAKGYGFRDYGKNQGISGCRCLVHRREWKSGRDETTRSEWRIRVPARSVTLRYFTRTNGMSRIRDAPACSVFTFPFLSRVNQST